MGDRASHDRSVFKLLDGNVRVWVEPEEGIYLKAAEGNDPVELTKEMAKQLATALLEMAARLDD
jgi:hypothetical protein